MALAPKLKLLAPQDAKNSIQFDFQFSGNQIYANRLIIKENSTNQTVYDVKTSSFQSFVILNANTLSNGHIYNVSISVFDKDDIESPLSAPILLMTFTTPVIAFTNLTADQVIRNSFYTFTFTYSQAEGELLSEYQITLYDVNKNEISTTGILTNTTNLSGTLYGFLDNTQYFVKLSINTVNSFQIDSDYIPFSVDYVLPKSYSKLILENNPSNGTIHITSNVTLINGTTVLPPSYIDGTKIDLSANGQTLTYDDNFTFSGDVTKEIVVEKLKPYTTFWYAQNDFGDSIFLKYMLGKFAGDSTQKCYFRLIVKNKLASYTLASQPMDILSDTQQVGIIIQRKSNLYGLYITLL